MNEITIRGLKKDCEWDYENGFYWFSGPERIGKLCAQYELYKRILGLPGDVLEFGVYKGASLIRFATFRNMLEAQHSRKIIGFDAFGKFPRDVELVGDQAFIERFENAGGDGLTLDETATIFRSKGLSENIQLIEGDIRSTLGQYLANNDQCRIALLHLDMDVYEPTRHVLNTCGDRMVHGGIIIIDDYNAVPGATRAVDEFTKERGYTIQKLPLSHVPSFITID